MPNTTGEITGTKPGKTTLSKTEPCPFPGTAGHQGAIPTATGGAARYQSTRRKLSTTPIMNPTDQQIIETMEQKGGQFVRCLAACFAAADSRNFNRLKREFMDYWTNYRILTIEEMKVAEREMEVAS